MASVEQAGAGVALAETERRFGAWREERRRGQRIPKELWQAAVDLVGHYPVEQVAGRLALNRRDLEKRLEAQEGGRVTRSVSQAGYTPGFVEVGRLGDGHAGTCTIETEDGSGARVIVRLNGSACAQAGDIVRALRGERE
jgi:hypothetical protein